MRDGPIDYVKPGRPGGEPIEQGPFGARHPHLPAAAGQPLEQGDAAERIEMGGDLVEQQDRPPPGMFGDEIGMGEHEAEQQRLLLARRATFGGLALAEMGDVKIGAVRPGERAAGRRIAPTTRFELGGQRGLGILRRQPAAEREPGPRKGPVGLFRQPLPWPGSRASTSRSRKRRRPLAPSVNSRSIAGVSHSTASHSDSALAEAGAPLIRTCRRSGAAASVPVPRLISPTP